MVHQSYPTPTCSGGCTPREIVRQELAVEGGWLADISTACDLLLFSNTYLFIPLNTQIMGMSIFLPPKEQL